MKTFIQDGDVMEFTAPVGGVVAGTGVKIGGLVVIPTMSAAATEKFTAITRGVVDHDKLDAEAWTEGLQVNWDDTNKRFTIATTGNFKAGVAAAAAANPTDRGKVRLDGVNVGAALA